MDQSDDAKREEAKRRYEEYERRSAEIRQENAVLLDEFQAWMEAQ